MLRLLRPCGPLGQLDRLVSHQGSCGVLPRGPRITGHARIGDPAETILELIETKSEISYHPLPEDDPKQRRPDISRAREILGWEPKVLLDDGLERTLAYFKGRVEEQQAAE